MLIRDRIKELRRVKANELLPNPKNWRRHPRAQADALRGLLSEIGYADALLARETPAGLMLIDGHLRAETTPDAAVPVLVLDVTEAEADKMLLTLDPLAGMAEMEIDRIKALLTTVQSDNAAVQAMLARLADDAGIPRDPLHEPPAELERAAELQAKWNTQLGQLWLIEPHQLLCADATDTAQVGRLWNGERPALMVTDPPYGVEYDASWRNGRGGVTNAPVRQLGRVQNDNRADWSTVFAGSACDVVYAWHSGLYTVHTAQSLIGAGYEIRNQIIWVKHHFAMSRGNYHWQHEPCWYAVKQGARSGWVGDRTQSTYWDIAGLNIFGGARRGDDEPLGHSTQKPIECMARPIRNHSARGVYDPFCGTGTTLLAAHQLGRVGYGVEIDPGYVAITLERLAALGLKPELVDVSPQQ